TIQLTLPASLAAGAHRLAVLDASGNVIGWFALAVSSAALGATGADADAGLELAALLLGAGGVLVLTRLSRRRALARQRVLSGHSLPPRADCVDSEWRLEPAPQHPSRTRHRVGDPQDSCRIVLTAYRDNLARFSAP